MDHLVRCSVGRQGGLGRTTRLLVCFPSWGERCVQLCVTRKDEGWKTGPGKGGCFVGTIWKIDGGWRGMEVSQAMHHQLRVDGTWNGDPGCPSTAGVGKGNPKPPGSLEASDRRRPTLNAGGT